MALTYSKGTENWGVIVEKQLHFFYGATLTGISIKDNVVGIEYELNGEKSYLITTPHCLLGAITVTQTLFKTPLENHGGSHISNKIHG